MCSRVCLCMFVCTAGVVSLWNFERLYPVQLYFMHKYNKSHGCRSHHPKPWGFRVGVRERMYGELSAHNTKHISPPYMVFCLFLCQNRAIFFHSTWTWATRSIPTRSPKKRILPLFIENHTSSPKKRWFRNISPTTQKQNTWSIPKIDLKQSF